MSQNKPITLRLSYLCDLYIPSTIYFRNEQRERNFNNSNSSSNLEIRKVATNIKI